MNKQASIDLGTNTCLLLVREGNGSVLHDESTVVRLGQGVDQSGMLHADAMKRTKECLSRYAQIAKRLGVEPSQIVAVGTASSRDASNSTLFYSEIESELGIRFRVLSGDEEARATFLGASLPEIDRSSMVVMDIGGGSTELVALPDPKGKLFGQSLNIGAVRMTERHLKSDPVSDPEFWACEDAIDRELSKMKSWRADLSKNGVKHPKLIAVAGTAVTLAMVQMGLPQFDRTQIDGVVLFKGDLHRLVEEFKWRSAQERAEMTGMEPKRADVILAGALLFWRVMEELDFDRAWISTRGLRYGVFDL